MKKYIIAFGLFCLSLFLIDNAYASATTKWADFNGTIKRPEVIFGNFCTSATSCNGTSMPGYQRDDPWSWTFSSFDTPTNGYVLGFNTSPIMRSNSIYSATIYLCHNNSATWELDDIRTGNVQSQVKNGTYKSVVYLTTGNVISGVPAELSTEFTTCQYIQAIFRVVDVSGQYIGFKLDHSKGITTADSFYGYSLDYLGLAGQLTTNDIQNVIDSSNLAKASSIEEVKKAQEEIKTELKNTQDSIDKQTEQQNKNHKETMDTITSEDAPDSSQYGNVAGWLPAGTIDTLINLPLSMLTSINNSATATCSPYQLPFINNTTLTLPCIGNYLENLDGFGTVISSIDLLMSVFLLYKLLMSLYKDIQKHLDLKNTDSDLGGIE